jgi:hypothetical protein
MEEPGLGDPGPREEPVSEIPDCVKLFDKLFAKGGTADYTRWADFVDGTDE